MACFTYNWNEMRAINSAGMLKFVFSWFSVVIVLFILGLLIVLWLFWCVTFEDFSPWIGNARLILVEQFILLSLTLTDEKPLEEVHADVVSISGKLILAGSDRVSVLELESDRLIVVLVTLLVLVIFYFIVSSSW